MERSYIEFTQKKTPRSPLLAEAVMSCLAIAASACLWLFVYLAY